MLKAVNRYRWLLVGMLFALCIAPTFISYRPYLFSWDDSDYLRQAIEVSRALWSGSIHGLGAMVGIRPPLMALLEWPWGQVTSWDAAGDSFVSLAVLTSLLVAFCLYLLLRIGVRPLVLLAASACVFASLGPFPHATHSIDLKMTVMAAAANWASTAFLADNVFAWTCLAAVLLIPYTARISLHSTVEAVLHGVLWGLVLSLGVMTKLDFFYFVVLIIPLLFLITLHRAGPRYTLGTLAGCVLSTAPAAFYLVRWGGPAFRNMKASSFGGISNNYYIPAAQFFTACVHESPGLLLSAVLVSAGVSYLAMKKRLTLRSPDFLAFVIMSGFAVIVFLATNKQIRYAFPAVVAMPFLTAVLVSGKGESISRRSAAFAAIAALSTLVAAATPMRHRAEVQSISGAEAVLAQGAACHAHSILLATDSPTLNWPLMQLAVQVSPSEKSIRCDSLANQAMDGIPIAQDFQAIRRADAVVIQDKDRVFPPFTNVRAAEYSYYVHQLGYVSTKVEDGITVYSKRCEHNGNTTPR